MAKILPEISKTFSEFLLIPGLTTAACTPDRISMKTPLTKFSIGQEPELSINIPFTSAIMQAVSDDGLAIALARCGGLSFIYSSQPIDSQAEMIRKVKKYKAGFVVSDTNLTPYNTITEVLALKEKTGHSTMAVTDNGTPNGKLLGLLTGRDYRPDRADPAIKVGELMVPFEKLICGQEGINLEQANDLIWDHKLNTLPIVSADGRLLYLVFRKDYDAHQNNTLELIDEQKRFLVGAGINTHDFRQRIPALLQAGADVLCIDSSDGFSQWQKETIEYIKNTWPQAKVGGGNIVDAEGFRFLAYAGADFIKIGIGGGSICITREQKGIGRGQASAIIEVARERDKYFAETGVYIPLCSDGGIVHDYHITLALAMGADFVMLGRYFARFDESPTSLLKINGNYVKEYWGEGSGRARNWQRYKEGGSEAKMNFDEGVDVYVPYAGKLKDNLDVSIAKIRSTMSSCGAKDLAELRSQAKIVEVSLGSIRENGAHDVIIKENKTN
jgi:IMP dehydrogenase